MKFLQVQKKDKGFLRKWKKFFHYEKLFFLSLFSNPIMILNHSYAFAECGRVK